MKVERKKERKKNSNSKRVLELIASDESKFFNWYRQLLLDITRLSYRRGFHTRVR